uniref:dolichyl-diphosphooligosaccharide--protein glycotransferase n=1 Tax=Heterorhabditis bacteriophora TaxID=37862 RepID=A0A1I7XT88_HETBA
MAGETGLLRGNSLGATTLLTFAILSLAWFVGFASRLFAIVRFESIIHEFDPWFNYRATHHMVQNGFYNFLNWFDERAWYPLGRIVGGTVYPGLMLTSGLIHWVLDLLNFHVHIRYVVLYLNYNKTNNRKLFSSRSSSSSSSIVVVVVVKVFLYL